VEATRAAGLHEARIWMRRQPAAHPLAAGERGVTAHTHTHTHTHTPCGSWPLAPWHQENMQSGSFKRPWPTASRFRTRCATAATCTSWFGQHVGESAAWAAYCPGFASTRDSLQPCSCWLT
jgi:hypothetical protein